MPKLSLYRDLVNEEVLREVFFLRPFGHTITSSLSMAKVWQLYIPVGLEMFVENGLHSPSHRKELLLI